MVSPKQLVYKRGSGSEHEFFHHITWLYKAPASTRPTPVAF